MLTSLNITLEECEKDVDDLEVLEEVLGEGEYGIVYKGRCMVERTETLLMLQ